MPTRNSWLAAGKFKVEEDVIDGLDNAPRALIGLLADAVGTTSLLYYAVSGMNSPLPSRTITKRITAPMTALTTAATKPSPV